MLVSKTLEWDMGHRVPNHKSKCKNLHGHRYKIEIFVDDKIIDTTGASDEGMVIDFGDIKTIGNSIIDEELDHGFMVYEQDSYYEIFKNLKEDGQKIIFVPFIPTAENISKWLFKRLERLFKARNIRLHSVKIWETPTSTAEFTQYNLLSE